VPRRVAVGDDAHPFRRKTIERVVELGALDADRVGREVRVGGVPDAEDVADAAQRDEAGAKAEFALGVARDRDAARHEGGRIEHRPRRRDPRALGARRAEEREARNRRVALLDVGEQRLPARPERLHRSVALETADAVEPEHHVDGRRRRACPHL